MSETHLTGSVSGRFDWNEYQIEYTAIVSGTEWYQQGRMYMPNGDPGYPDEYDCEGPFFEDFDEIIVTDAEGNDVTDTPGFEDQRPLIEEKIKEDVKENKDWDDCNWDDPEPDYPDDPPEDDDWEDD